MQVVVKICAGGHDPVHKTGFHQWYEARLSKSGWCERSGQTHADKAVVWQHLFREKFGGLAQASAVVGEKRFIDQIGGGNIPADSQRIEPWIGGKFVTRTHGREIISIRTSIATQFLIPQRNS